MGEQYFSGRLWRRITPKCCGYWWLRSGQRRKVTPPRSHPANFLRPVGGVTISQPLSSWCFLLVPLKRRAKVPAVCCSKMVCAGRRRCPRKTSAKRKLMHSGPAIWENSQMRQPFITYAAKTSLRALASSFSGVRPTNWRTGASPPRKIKTRGMVLTLYWPARSKLS
jgi:hypothetical protein